MLSSLRQPLTRSSEAASDRCSKDVATLATQVCSTCKTRKKKCDKKLPRCAFCVRKGLDCEYNHDAEPSSPLRAHIRAMSAIGISSTVPPRPLLRSSVVSGGFEAGLYSQVHGAIRAAGLFVDDVSVFYFRSIHPVIPIVSRTRFHNDLITLGATPSADFSALLLVICLVASCPAFERHAKHAVRKTSLADQKSLYVTARSLFAQTQAMIPPSLYLVQAGLLLALYEYVVGQPDRAFASIADCARMAYAAGIHDSNLPPSRSAQVSRHDAAAEKCDELKVREAYNTWWGIIICERIFLCDVSNVKQPLVTTFPRDDALLPGEPATLEQSILSEKPVCGVPVSCLSSSSTGSFGRTAQAAWLLDRVFQTFDIADTVVRRCQLQILDTTLQSFLRTLMQQPSAEDKSCQAVTITIRALFALHLHILDLCASPVDERYQALLNQRKSCAALDAISNIVFDVLDAVENDNADSTPCVTLSYPYLIQACLEQVRKRTGREEHNWLRSAEFRLPTSLNQLYLNRAKAPRGQVHDVTRGQ